MDDNLACKADIVDKRKANVCQHHFVEIVRFIKGTHRCRAKIERLLHYVRVRATRGDRLQRVFGRSELATPMTHAQ